MISRLRKLKTDYIRKCIIAEGNAFEKKNKPIDRSYQLGNEDIEYYHNGIKESLSNLDESDTKEK
jgi:hypothetical protein